MSRDLIEDLALIAHPAPRAGEVDPSEAYDDARDQMADRREAYAENLRAMIDDIDEDPLLAELRAAAGRRDDGEGHVRALLTYARRFTGSRPDYTWETLAAAAGLPYSTARRAVGEQDVAALHAALGSESGTRPRPRWLNPPRAQQRDDEPTPVLLGRDEIALLCELLQGELHRVETAIDEDRTAATSGLLDAEQAARRERRASLTNLHANLTWAPESPDTSQCSREATWHPAAQLSRLMPSALSRLARWSGGRALVTNAVRHAAAIEADRTGWDGVRSVATAAVAAGQNATEYTYGHVAPPERAEPTTETVEFEGADEPASDTASLRELRPGEQLHLTRAQLDDYTLTDVSPTDESGTYQLEIAGVRLGIIDRPETRRTGWQARSLHHQPLGTPTRTRQDAVVQLLQHLPGLQIDDA